MAAHRVLERQGSQAGGDATVRFPWHPSARAVWLFLVLFGMAVPRLFAQPQPLERYRFSREQMGTPFVVVLYAPDSMLAHKAAQAAYARIDTLNRHLSDYLTDSELNQLSATAGTEQARPVGDDLWTVLRAAQRVAFRTEGAFDVTVGPLTRLWRWAMRRGRLPLAEELERAREAVGYRYILLDSTGQSVHLTRPAMRLDLGGIAKGYAVDEALKVLAAYGVTRALVDGGGDIRVGDPPPDESGWRIELTTVDAEGQRNRDERILVHSAIATSGAAYRYVEVDGIRYSHILDPRTGMGLTDDRLVTVIAPTGMRADALASAVSVLGLDDGLALVAEMPGVAVRIVQGDAAGYRQLQSPGFDGMALLP